MATAAQLDWLRRVNPSRAYANKYGQVIAVIDGDLTVAVLGEGETMARSPVETSMDPWSEQAVEFDWRHA
jgi:hypothetical protein